MSRTEHSSSSGSSQRLREAPPATAYVLQLANAIPCGVEASTVIPRVPTTDEIERFGDFLRAYQAIWLADLSRRIAQEGWAEPARAHVFEPREVQEVDARYYEAHALRALLMSIAEQNESRDKGYHGEIALSLPPSTDLLDSLTLLVSRSSKQARLQPRGLLKDILDEGELDRIRRCAYEKCQRLFWAGRVDRPCCQESCRNAYKQKRHRERERQNRVNRKAMKRRNRND